VSDSDLIPGTVARLLYASSGVRCTVRINPKRPTWRCKNAPIWMWMADESEPDGRKKADWWCDEHYRDASR
jgi:hypothetical protein